jgi:hypothetical protein
LQFNAHTCNDSNKILSKLLKFMSKYLQFFE